MLCKNCGRELPIAGQFCPFCGATVEQTGVNDETAVFTSLPEELNGPIDLSAFDAIMKEDHHAGGPSDGVTTGDPLAVTDPRVPRAGQIPPADVPPARRTTSQLGAQRTGSASRPNSAPRTTYFSEPDPDDRPYRKPSKGKRGAVVAVVVLLVIALIGGGVWFFISRQPDENLTTADKYFSRGNFDKALEYFQKAQQEAKDPTTLDATIQLIQDFQTAQDYVENGQYTEAIAALKQLQNRVTDPSSAMYSAIEDLLAQAEAGQSDSEFAADVAEVESYLADGKYDAAAGKLDSLAADDSLTADQKKQLEDLREELTKAQEKEQQKQENEEKQNEQRSTFSSRMDELESNDLQIASAATPEDELALTASSFEAWDTLLVEMYDYLATILNADQYAAEEESYKQWIDERDSGAANAAKESSDETAGQLASYSFKQSYTKARCYKLLDLM